MPIYEYVCETCGHEFEQLAPSRQRDRAPACPACKKRRVTRKLSVFIAGQSAKPAPIPTPGTCGRCGQNGPCGGEF